MGRPDGRGTMAEDRGRGGGGITGQLHRGTALGPLCMRARPIYEGDPCVAMRRAATTADRWEVGDVDAGPICSQNDSVL